MTIQPFTLEIPQAEVDDLQARLRSARWPVTPAVDDWSRGVPVDYLRELAAYWADGYDWRAAEAALNAIPQFVTEIGGQRIHFFHQKSAEPNALPLILTHGWPGSPVEFQAMIGRLTDPVAYGGDAGDAFDVVVPSLPGYGFSTPLGPAGFNLFGVAQMWAELMSRLGYDRYGAHGTDAGSGVTGMLTMIDAEHVVGAHLAGVTAAAPFAGPVSTDGLSESDKTRAETFNRYLEDGLGYLTLQSTRPQTLAYGLNDSPIGQLAWIVEKFAEWTDPAHKLPDEAVDRDQLLTNVSLYWFTGSGASSAHAVYDGMQAWKAMLAQQPGGEAAAASWGPASPPPTGVAVFGAETAIKSLVDPAGAMTHWTEYERGGHFAAMEVPDLLTTDLQTFFRPLR
ncbi:epoxide hydrolase [Kribbella albertanoniae]|uniref:Epoxide hydrolase n=1 Tax=Kribbella albertanoniae TaxID=1266829 RepID=A0A4R4NYD1_9ACTN|nr:epoxide hydrolase [Kribbella albertanoniae]TDC14575.1 epoxide hydrolase [Kribbella albertanoniae]